MPIARAEQGERVKLRLGKQAVAQLIALPPLGPFGASPAPLSARQNVRAPAPQSSSVTAWTAEVAPGIAAPSLTLPPRGYQTIRAGSKSVMSVSRLTSRVPHSRAVA